MVYHTWYKIVIILWIICSLFLVGIGLFSLIFQTSNDDYIAIFYGIAWLIGLLLFHFIIYNGIYKYFYKKYIMKEIDYLSILREKGMLSKDEYNSKLQLLKDKLNGIS